MRKFFVILSAGLTLLAFGCSEGSNPIVGTCQPGETATCDDGTTRTCVNGQFTACQSGNVCTPNTKRDCVTDCNGAKGLGTETCDANGNWGSCVGGAEECNGKDDNCNGQIDEGLVQDCLTDCGSGKIQCINAAWSLCSAPSPQVELCDGKDNDCDKQTDEGLNAQPASKTFGVCSGQVQTCEGVKGWTDPDWSKLANYEASEATCDGLDNNCDGNTDNVAGGCACTSQTCSNDAACAGVEGCANGGCRCQANNCVKECGKDEGECSKGYQTCVQTPGGGNAWTECGGEQYNGEKEEVCNGLDDNCDGVTDENLGDPETCGTANNDGQGGSYYPPCTYGFMICQGGKTICSGGVNPAPESCDTVDNDCDGKTDESIESDQQEPNNSCSAAADLGKAIENQDPLIVNGTLYDPGSTEDDVDWYKVTAAEAGGFCLPGNSEGPFTVTIRLTNIPAGSDYDLCVWNAADSECGALTQTDGVLHDEGPGGYCMSQQIFKTGADPEEFSFQWDGECLQNDDQTFYVKVVGYTIDPDIDCAPYNLEVTVTK